MINCYRSWRLPKNFFFFIDTIPTIRQPYLPERLSENSECRPLCAAAPHWIPAFAGMTAPSPLRGPTRSKVGF